MPSSTNEHTDAEWSEVYEENDMHGHGGSVASYAYLATAIAAHTVGGVVDLPDELMLRARDTHTLYLWAPELSTFLEYPRIPPTSLLMEPVIDELSTPPVGPTTGDRYLVGDAATGAWVGMETYIAEYDGAAWQFTAPVEGNEVWITNLLSKKNYSGVTWHSEDPNVVSPSVIDNLPSFSNITGEMKDSGYSPASFVPVGSWGSSGLTGSNFWATAAFNNAGAAYLQKNNFSAITNPTVNDDITQGYSIGSIWINLTLLMVFTCRSVSAGVAVWIRLSNDMISVIDFGTVGDGVTDDTAAILAANTAVSGGGVLYFPIGKYLMTAPIPLNSKVIYQGAGSGKPDATDTGCSLILNATSSIFSIPNGATIEKTVFDNLKVISEVGGGHIFDLSEATGSLANCEFKNLTLIQKNAAKSVVEATTVRGVFGCNFHDFTYWYAAASSVPALNFNNAFLSHITIKDFWSFGSSVTAGDYSILFNMPAAGRTATNCIIENGIFETPTGGCVKMAGCSVSEMKNLRVWDITLPAISPFFSITIGSGGDASINIVLSHIFSNEGTAAIPDIQIDSPNAVDYVTLMNCYINWLDGITAGAKIYTAINSTIVNTEDINLTRISRDSILLRNANTGIESDGASLYLKAASRTYLNNNNTAYLDIYNTLRGVNRPVTVTTDAHYAVLPTDEFIYGNAVGNAVSVDLPAATGSGRVLTIKKIDATTNTVTVTANGAETIDLSPTQVITTPQTSFSVQDYAAGLWAIH